MVTVLSGVALLVATLAVFSLFSLKMPKGSLAMSGMADAAVATFLVEAIHSYISGDLVWYFIFKTGWNHIRKHGWCCSGNHGSNLYGS